MPPASIDDFRRLDLRVGVIRRAEPNTGARDPAYRLWIDFGPEGIRQSSAKLTERYEPATLVGRQVVAVCGFPPLRVGGFRSDVLVLGVPTDDGVVLLGPETPVPPGAIVA